MNHVLNIFCALCLELIIRPALVVRDIHRPRASLRKYTSRDSPHSVLARNPLHAESLHKVPKFRGESRLVHSCNTTTAMMECNSLGQIYDSNTLCTIMIFSLTRNY